VHQRAHQEFARTDNVGYFAFPGVTSAPGDDDLRSVSAAQSGARARLYKLETWSNDFSTVADYPCSLARPT